MNCAQKLNFDACDQGNKWNSTDLSIETSGCDMSDSFNSSTDCLSPTPGNILPRKLDFTKIDDADGTPMESPAPKTPMSPPYKRVRALRLFDSPATPKTILEKCFTPSHPGPRSRLFPPRLPPPTGKPPDSTNNLLPPSESHSLPLISADSSSDSLDVNSLTGNEEDRRPTGVTRSLANINPFTPDGQLLIKKKRALSKTPVRTLWESTTVREQPAKRLKESNISRYHVEFLELGSLGAGDFGRVTRCINIMDGCVYALKRSLKPVAGSAGERSALNEVYAHAVLGKHPHVVRYYSAWAEDDHMIIQNEYCDGGSLQSILSEKGALNESELLVLLAHVTDGLRYIHSMKLVHMDIKPGNIFVARESNTEVCYTEGGRTDGRYDSADDGFDERDDEQIVQDEFDNDDNLSTPPSQSGEITYKIGDLGHVTCLSSPQVEEGDCRYLPNEVLHEDFSNLTKADIFALGLTLYEAGGGGPLPKNGPEWHSIRNGQIPDLPQYSRELNQLIKKMVHPDPVQRPSAPRLLKHPLLHPCHNKSRAQLQRELAAAKLRNELLARKLQEAARCIKSLAPTVAAFNNNNNITGAETKTLARTRSGKTRNTEKYSRNATNQALLTVENQMALVEMLESAGNSLGMVANNSRRSKRSGVAKFARSNSNVNF